MILLKNCPSTLAFSPLDTDYNNKHSIKGEELLVYRVGIYLQNHKTEGGLQVLSESHKKSSKSCK